MKRQSFHHYLVIGIVLSIVALAGATASGQVTTGTIQGTVVDQTEALISGAKVTVVRSETASSRAATTDEHGRFSFTLLPVGTYNITVEAPSFQKLSETGFILNVGQVVNIELKLTVGQIEQEIEVQAEAPLVDSTTSTIGSLVNERTVSNLPLNQRSFTSLAIIQPGVLSYNLAISNTSASVQNHQGTMIVVNGQPPGNGTFLMDGVDISDASNSSGSPAGAAGDILGVESIREFKVVSQNFTAEFGKASAGVITYVTKSGTNALHGSVFEFLRNDALDARNFFDRADVPPFKRNQFGASVGGPMWKNRTFFFANYEGFRQRLTTTQIGIVPDENARRGILPTGNVTVNPAVVPYLNLYPRPNGRNFGDGKAEFFFPNVQPSNQDYAMGKIDHNLSPTDTLSGLYIFTQADARNTRALPGYEDVKDSRFQYLSLRETKILSARTVNVFNFGFNRSRTQQIGEVTANVDPSLYFLPSRGQFGAILVGGSGDVYTSLVLNPFSQLGQDGNVPIVIRQDVFQIGDALSYTRGGHSLKTGMELKRYRLNYIRNTNPFGQFSFPSLAALVQGVPSVLQLQSAASVTNRYLRTTQLGMFVQDDWKIHRNFTLNLGLRYEFNTMPKEKYGRVANLAHVDDPFVSVGALVPDNPLPQQVGPVFKRNPTLRQLQPRFGFAYDVLGNGKTSIRGGFGVYNAFIPLSTLMQQINSAPPFFGINVFAGSNLPFPTIPESFLTSPSLLLFGTLEPDGSTTSLQWNLTIEQEIGGQMALHIGYIGSHSYHIGHVQSGNPKVPEIRPDGSFFFPATAPFLNTNWRPGTLIVVCRYDGNGNYNALNAGITRRLSGGLQFDASYTWSKSLEDADGPFAQTFAPSMARWTMNPYNRRLDYALSPFNPIHRFTANVVWQLPLGPGKLVGGSTTGAAARLLEGWMISAIGIAQSGLPMTVQLGFNNSRDGNSSFVSERPDWASGFTGNVVRGGADQYFDPAAFSIPAPGTYGNVGRNAIIGPDLSTLDLALQKDIRIRETAQIQFRVEAFNALNRTNLGLPSLALYLPGAIRNGAAGRILNTATTSRQMQFALKFVF